MFFCLNSRRGKKRVGKLCYHMLSQMEKQFVLSIMYIRRLRYLPSATDNKSFLPHYIKKRWRKGFGREVFWVTFGNSYSECLERVDACMILSCNVGRTCLQPSAWTMAAPCTKFHIMKVSALKWSGGWGCVPQEVMWVGLALPCALSGIWLSWGITNEGA